MPSYPNSIKAFASRSAGQNIDASHVNDLQDEVNAVETALITGPITLPTVSVTGTLTTAVPPGSARLALNANLDTPHNSTLAIAWSTATFKTTASIHSTASNPSRIFPPSSGVWAFQATLVGNTNVGSTAYLEVVIKDSSGGVIGVNRGQLDNSGIPTANAFGLKYFDSLSATPYARVVVKSVYAGSTTSLDAAQTACNLFKIGY